MAISIRSQKVEKLARQLARQRGITMTEAISEALEHRVAGQKANAPGLLAALTKIATECAALPDLDTRTVEEILGYDNIGGFESGH